MRHRGQQAGFGTVELLLVIVLVAVVGLAGILIYQHHDKTSLVKSTASTSPSQPSSQVSGTASMQPAPTTTQYFNIKEWGVRAPYSGSLKLTYTMSPDNQTAKFSSDQLTALSSDCAEDGGGIIRWASTDQVSNGPADASTPTATNYFAGKSPSTYAHIGNYYYMFVHAQSACGDLKSTSAVQSQTNDAVKALVPTLQATTN